ncbi:gastrula zinc finger protein XlCGF9.1-like [Triplophysa dalaica]|uniref:gastrula zinc finger protein XlCGF9.1-like n=1 Tax=Triplophysa dalaica TaxID=1582913 RepID=UPI0024E014B2|nr:gastrula zinc finger protein XlCGF9.1-like [Triplophysa dalaica]XP_056599100.1 gastrula zinc finger protein XlCGF9.1-like [Triplophysa dalaica]XP_056599101.1 gastrula zinc finger protein XlCGF9.1-like [Triplophysa dalaica]
MQIVKEEIEEMSHLDPCGVKNEDTEEQTDLLEMKDVSDELNGLEETHQYQKPHRFKMEEISSDCSEMKNTCSNTRQRTRRRKSFTCPQCEEEQTLKTDFDLHIRVHTGEKMFTCPQCGKQFSYREQFRNHIRTHTKERLHPCLQCEKSFRETSMLSNHMRIHTGERPYPCPQCGKSFRENGTLNNHMRIMCPHVCPQCVCPQNVLSV